MVRYLKFLTNEPMIPIHHYNYYCFGHPVITLLCIERDQIQEIRVLPGAAVWTKEVYIPHRWRLHIVNQEMQIAEIWCVQLGHVHLLEQRIVLRYKQPFRIYQLG